MRKSAPLWSRVQIPADAERPNRLVELVSQLLDFLYEVVEHANWPDFLAVLAANCNAEKAAISKQLATENQQNETPGCESVKLVGTEEIYLFKDAAQSGSSNVAWVPLASDAGHLTGLHVSRPESRGDFEHPELHLLSVVAPHLRRALRLTSMIEECGYASIRKREDMREDTLAASRAHTLRTRYRLTPAECVLAELVAAGRRLSDCAHALRITEGTARVRLKSIFRKTQTCRQAELVRLLLTIQN